MDKRKDTISSLKICRFCLTQNVPMSSLYDKKRKVKNTVSLHLKILSSVSVEVFPSDKMPTYICERCKYFMNLSYDFKNICRQADESILHYIQDNKPIKAIAWPVTLNEAYRESNDIGVMNTIVEDGTAVQVTHDISDSEEEEEENVYNVKISDGNDEVSKTCVKVVASRDNEDKLEKGSGGNCWPCDACDCTYPLQQMLELHKVNKHRQRNVLCDKCDEKFYTKYDLATHQLRHTVAMPFECIVCSRKFKRMILLRRHEKLKHADLAQYMCPHCPASFLTDDKLEDHLKKHDRLAGRTFSCLLCGKKFKEKATLHRHIQFIHNRKLNFICEYCPQRFSSVTKLSRHVRSHAGERPYPCKYCDKSFMKSHHYTRHVRMKHREEERVRDGINDTYPCDQCDATFGGQDELIFHSAIHATQNLTCPLCQEKFDTVDEVTAHIKSHVNGMEFMCDFCELVFTTKEKLENHMLITHEDEIQNELGQDESSMDAEDMKDGDGDGDDDDDDDNSINVKEEDDDNMVIEIKKADEFLLKKRTTAEATATEEKLGDNSSEDSDAETNYMERATIEKVATVKMMKEAVKPDEVVTKSMPQAKADSAEKFIVRKSEDIKRGPIQQRVATCDSPVEKKEKQVMAQVTKIETGNDKSLRLLEKELQDLKRTNSRSEAVKTPPVKILETPRGRGRPPLHCSTPKIKPTEEKKPLIIMKTVVVEKKQLDKKVITKENKEPKVVKETKPNNYKEDKDNNKNAVKNGTNEKSSVEEGIRRSTRPCKIKDYAKMIRVNTQDNSDSDEIDDDDDEYKQGDKTMDGRVRARRNSVRPAKGSPAPSSSVPASPTSVASPATPTSVPPRKRGRPRKEQPKEIPSKIKKIDPESDPEQTPEAMEEQPSPEPNKPSAATNQSNTAANQSNPVTEQSTTNLKPEEDSQDSNITEPEPETENKVSEATSKEEEAKSKPDEGEKVNSEERKSPHVEPEAPPSPSKIISPTGQTLKKIPIRSLPPGVKPLPLPLVGRSLATGELCQMQIGKKVVKVQKIVMTKAEVEAMAKQGLVEMKDGTMVLKQGVKIPKVEALNIKPVAAEDKDSPGKRERAVPTRCNLGDE